MLKMERMNIGNVGDLPGLVRMITTDDLVTITTAGYLGNNVNSPARLIGLSNLDQILCGYLYNEAAGTCTLKSFQPSITNGVITLVALS